jgi:hypothetical protein
MPLYVRTSGGGGGGGTTYTRLEKWILRLAGSLNPSFRFIFTCKKVRDGHSTSLEYFSLSARRIHFPVEYFPVESYVGH